MYRAPRGTIDILPQDQPYWQLLQQRAETLCQQYGYERIDTPVFEQAGLFIRTVGAGTDIVQKETYTFPDRGGDLLTLRAEGTAPVCRAYIQHGMAALPQPVRLFYLCSIYRYERPQAGRYREHRQLGIEALGDADPAVDAEVVELAWRFLTGLGLTGLSLLVNSIGCLECRPRYLEALKAYYGPLLSHVCRDCRDRYHRSPLRLLDCKQEACWPLSLEAPRSIHYLCAACQEHWDRFRSYLKGLDLPCAEDHRLVRGLDYYTRTVFEVQPLQEGAQSTICGGGRYDGLIQEMGGRLTPGVGFGMGLERVVLNLKRQGVVPAREGAVKVFLAYVGEEAKLEALRLAARLRAGGTAAVLASGTRSLKGQLRQATGLGARYAMLLGDKELRRGCAVLRDLARGEQREVLLEQAAAELASTLGS